MMNLGTVLLLLLMFSVYTEAPTIDHDYRPSTRCPDVEVMEGSNAFLSFISSLSLAGIQWLNIIRDANGTRETVLELSGGNVSIPTILADGFQFHGVADTIVTLEVNKATSEMEGTYYMETNQAVYDFLLKKCYLTVNPKVPESRPPVNFSTTASSNVPELRPPVNSSNGPWQVYSAVVTVVLVILILIVLYKRRDYKQMRKRLDKQRDQSPPTEIKVVGQSEDGGRKNDSTETNDQGIIEQVKWKKPMLVASSQQASGQEQGDMLGDIHVDGEDRKRMEADNLCSDVTSAPAVSSPTPVLSMGDGCTPPQATCSIEMQQEPPRGASAARNVAAGNRQHTAPHGHRPVDTTLSMRNGFRPPLDTNSIEKEELQRGERAARYGNHQHTAPHGDRPVDTRPEEQPLLDHHTRQECNGASSPTPDLSSLRVHDDLD